VYVFAYGTLTEPERASALLDDWSDAGTAELVGLHRVEGTYPTLAPGGRVEGRLLHVFEEDLDRLDAYEDVEDGLYVRVSVPLTAGHPPGPPVPATADVYVGDPERLDAPATWPGDGTFGERVQAYLRDHEVVLRATDAL